MGHRKTGYGIRSFSIEISPSINETALLLIFLMDFPVTYLSKY